MSQPAGTKACCHLHSFNCHQGDIARSIIPGPLIEVSLNHHEAQATRDRMAEEFEQGLEQSILLPI